MRGEANRQECIPPISPVDMKILIPWAEQQHGDKGWKGKKAKGRLDRPVTYIYIGTGLSDG